MGRGNINPPIAHAGYSYHAKKLLADGTRYVYCSERIRQNCRVVGYIRPNRDLSPHGVHTHVPDDTTVKVC